MVKWSETELLLYCHIVYNKGGKISSITWKLFNKQFWALDFLSTLYRHGARQLYSSNLSETWAFILGGGWNKIYLVWIITGIVEDKAILQHGDYFPQAFLLHCTSRKVVDRPLFFFSAENKNTILGTIWPYLNESLQLYSSAVINLKVHGQQYNLKIKFTVNKS